MAALREDLREDVRFRVLRLLEENPEMSQRELARAVGISVGGAHYVLSALLDKGLVKLGNFSSARDRRRYAYVLTPRGIAEKTAITRRFLARKMAEYDALRAEIAALSAELDAASKAGARKAAALSPRRPDEAG
jgi:EPS-associated MarR family transcriptional regulator